MKRIRKGFTLIEMVIVLFIISLLLLIMIPNLTAQKKNATTKSDDAFKTSIVTQAEMYSDEHGDKEVTLDNMKKDNYVSDNQVEHATKLHLKLFKTDKGWELLSDEKA